MALKPDSCIVLNDGHKIPAIGFGTFAPATYTKDQAREGTEWAIETGYRLIDSAYIYMNEPQVGQAIRAKIADGMVKREDIFYITKLWNSNRSPERVLPALKQSLNDLQLDYVDCLLIHTPVEFKPGPNPFPKDENGKLIFHKTDFRDTWKAMEACKDAGLTRSIGVSNFNRRQLERILTMPDLKYKPACNEIEYHIYLDQTKLLKFCHSHDIAVIAYAVMGSGRAEGWLEDPNAPVLIEDPVLCALAKKLKHTPAQVAIRYILQKGAIPLAKSFDHDRIKHNFEIFDFELCDEDMKVLDGLNKKLRYFTLNAWREHCEFPFDDEF